MSDAACQLGAATGATQDPGALGLGVSVVTGAEVLCELAAALRCAPWGMLRSLKASILRGFRKRAGHKNMA